MVWNRSGALQCGARIYSLEFYLASDFCGIVSPGMESVSLSRALYKLAMSKVFGGEDVNRPYWVLNRRSNR